MKRGRQLLLVLVIVLSLGGIAFKEMEIAQARFHENASVMQIHDLSAAAMAYAAANGRLPATIAALLTASPSLSPGAATSPLASDKTVPSYEMVAPALPLQSHPSGTPMIRSLFTTRDGNRIVVFCDGHIEKVAE
jgi:hypothetical protein